MTLTSTPGALRLALRHAGPRPAPAFAPHVVLPAQEARTIELLRAP
jgi:hypothetical protein